MNLLLINQPVENRGDESAHRSLIRAFLNHWPEAHVTAAFVGENRESVRQMEVAAPKVAYAVIPLKRGASRIPELALKWHMERLVVNLHPAYRHLRGLIEAADYVVNAPGGICMGGFQSWRHIFYLLIAARCKKKTAYYSRSFGPFREDTAEGRLFKRISLGLLKNFDFLSIRDAQTMKLADQLGLRYVPAIDTAFLDVPKAAIPAEVSDALGSLDYVILVPNSMVWHVDYRTADRQKIDDFYISIIHLLRVRYPSSRIVLLPQLFNAGRHRDFLYLASLAERSPHRQYLTVLPDSYSSDVQQAIVAKARLVVGARYHAIVFAINNRVPFIALSYEHKISGMLSILNLEDRCLDVRSLGTPRFEHIHALEYLDKLAHCCNPPDAACRKARGIAAECFRVFASRAIAASNIEYSGSPIRN